MNDTYLGNTKHVFGFIKESHAKKVLKNLRYSSPILQISSSRFVVNRKPPHRLRKKYVVDKQQLNIQDKYARHVASDKLHSSLDKIIDKFVEIYIARSNGSIHIKNNGKPMALNIKIPTDKNAFTFVDNVIAFLMGDVNQYTPMKL